MIRVASGASVPGPWAGKVLVDLPEEKEDADGEEKGPQGAPGENPRPSVIGFVVLVPDGTDRCEHHADPEHDFHSVESEQLVDDDVQFIHCPAGFVFEERFFLMVVRRGSYDLIVLQQPSRNQGRVDHESCW